jgi:hypothetical protein
VGTVAHNPRGGSAGPARRPGSDAAHADRLTAADGERLSRALVAKSVAEALFVVALFAAFSYTHFHPGFRGAVDVADARAVEGWAVDEAEPGRRVEVQLFIDGQFVAQRRAELPRPDVLAAGRAAGAEHGFRFDTPPLAAREAEYEARVYALHTAAGGGRRTLNQIGQALRFRVVRGEGAARVVAADGAVPR